MQLGIQDVAGSLQEFVQMCGQIQKTYKNVRIQALCTKNIQKCVNTSSVCKKHTKMCELKPCVQKTYKNVRIQALCAKNLQKCADTSPVCKKTYKNVRIRALRADSCICIQKNNSQPQKASDGKVG